MNNYSIAGSLRIIQKIIKKIAGVWSIGGRACVMR